MLLRQSSGASSSAGPRGRIRSASGGARCWRMVDGLPFFASYPQDAVNAAFGLELERLCAAF